MRFDIDPGDDAIAGVPVSRDFSGPGEHRVRFVKHLRFAMPELRQSHADDPPVADNTTIGDRPTGEAALMSTGSGPGAAFL